MTIKEAISCKKEEWNTKECPYAIHIKIDYCPVSDMDCERYLCMEFRKEGDKIIYQCEDN